MVLTMGLIASRKRLGDWRFHGQFAAESLAVSPPLIGLVVGGALGIISVLLTSGSG